MWIKSIFENKDNAIDYYENNNNLSAIYINFHIKKTDNLLNDNGTIK